MLQVAVSPLVLASPEAVSQCDLTDIRAGTPYYKSCASGANPCSTGTASLVGSDDAQKAFNYFVSQGLAPFMSAGIVGNMQAESGVQPERLQSTPSGLQTPAESLTDYQLNHTGNGSVGWGIVQWTPPGKMINPTKAAGKNPNDISVQLDFLWAQLTTGSEKGAGDALKATTDVDSAAVSFLTKYERPLHPQDSQGVRITFAEQILKQYGGGAPTGNQTTDSTPTAGSGCSQQSASTANGYKNPLRDVQGVKGERMDQGVDYAGAGPFYALGNGVVIDVTTTAGWPGGNWVSFKLTDGPAAGKVIYVAEDCNVAVTIGQNVTTNTVLCNMFKGSAGIETGWAQDNTTQRALAYGEYHEGLATSYGQNFSQLMHSLGAPAGTIDKGVSSVPLPAGWPTWGVTN